MDQHQFVQEAYKYYAENLYEPGNPEDGIWEECHYPVPKCKGGTLIILLLKQHHAIQGVLQSEEYNHPCIYGWEKPHLPKEYLSLWAKWMAKKAEAAMNYINNLPREVKSEWGLKGSLAQSREGKSKGGKAAIGSLSAEQKRERASHMQNLSPEKKKAAVEKATKTNLQNNPNHFHDMARKARDSETHEVKAARAKAIPKEAILRACAIINSRKFRCTVTGHVSTAGPLSRYQKARGIDTSNREPVR
jgi:hypothetical protein